MKYIVGPDGVAQIYADLKGGTQVYMSSDPDDDIFNVSYGTGSNIDYDTKKQGKLTYFTTTGHPITYHSGNEPGRSTRIDTYPDGGMWSNDTDYYWKDNPGYLYTKKGILNGEFTTFIRVHDDLGTHQAYAHKIGGRDEDAIRSLMEMVYPTEGHNSVNVNYNYAHFPYIKSKPKVFKKLQKLSEDSGWIGVKTIHIVHDDYTHWEMWIEEDPFKDDGTINNNWAKVAEYKDEGCDEYDNTSMGWRCHKDVCRVDGFGRVDFALFSDREIDPNSKPNAAIPKDNDDIQGKPERDDSFNWNSVEEVQAAKSFITSNTKISQNLSKLPQL